MVPGVSTENADATEAAEATGVTWTPGERPSFNSPAADLNQLRNEATRIADAAPGQEPADAAHAHLHGHARA